MITNVKVSNFKSFADSKIELSPLSVLVGPNGAGKSNFIDVFRFIQETLSIGPEPAIWKRYGWSGIRCRRKRSKFLEISIQGELKDQGVRYMRPEDGEMEEHSLETFNYGFTLKYDNQENGERVYVEKEYGSLISDEGKNISSFERGKEKVQISDGLRGEEIIPIDVQPTDQSRLFLSTGFFTLTASIVGDYLRNWQFYSIEPIKAKEPSTDFSAFRLSESGDTLSAIIHRFQENKEDATFKVLQSLMQDLVPGFNKLRTKRLRDGRISFEVKEDDIKGYLQSGQLSDGTVRILAILTALYSQRPPRKPSLLLIEEPERGLHPTVLESLVDLMREVSKETQIILTTHSPDLVRYCNADEVFMIDKAKGETQMVRASSLNQIEQFLRNFSLDELWTQGYLENISN